LANVAKNEEYYYMQIAQGIHYDGQMYEVLDVLVSRIEIKAMFTARYSGEIRFPILLDLTSSGSQICSKECLRLRGLKPCNGTLNSLNVRSSIRLGGDGHFLCKLYGPGVLVRVKTTCEGLEKPNGKVKIWMEK
jgi:hypothetical protein